jgi:FKBP12-rapamycin complex-associated protein
MKKENQIQKFRLLIYFRLTSVADKLAEYLYLIIPAVVNLVETTSTTYSIRLLALQTLGVMCRSLDLSEYASRIIHPISRLLQNSQTENALKEAALTILCFLLYKLRSDFAIFIPVLKRILTRQQQISKMLEYETLVTKLLKNVPLLESDLPKIDDWYPKPVGRRGTANMYEI